MSTRPPPSPLTSLADLSELDLPQEATPETPAVPPAVPWPSEFELEVKKRLASIEGHQLHTFSLVMDLQGEMRRGFKRVDGRLDIISRKFGELIGLLRDLKKGQANGHG